jgi:hypothetical protein
MELILEAGVLMDYSQIFDIRSGLESGKIGGTTAISHQALKNQAVIVYPLEKGGD